MARRAHPVLAWCAACCALVAAAEQRAATGPANRPLPSLPRKNASLVVPMGNDWRRAVKKVSNRLGERVACVVFFCGEEDVKTVGPMAGALAKELGSERPVFIGAVLEADDGTLGDSRLSLPHVLLLLPKHDELGDRPISSDPNIYAWDAWTPNAYSVDDRMDTVRRLAAFIHPKVDECSDSGRCDEVMDQAKLNAAHDRLEHDLKRQRGEQSSSGVGGPPGAATVKREVSFEPGSGLKMSEPEVLAAEGAAKQKRKRKGRKKKSKDEL